MRGRPEALEETHQTHFNVSCSVRDFFPDRPPIFKSWMEIMDKGQTAAKYLCDRFANPRPTTLIGGQFQITFGTNILDSDFTEYTPLPSEFEISLGDFTWY